MTKTREITVSAVLAGRYPGRIDGHRLAEVTRTETSKEVVMSKPSGGTQTVTRQKVVLLEVWRLLDDEMSK